LGPFHQQCLAKNITQETNSCGVTKALIPIAKRFKPN